jgi:hypothetical protein
VRLEALASGRSSHPDDILTYFLENIRKNIHIVLCMNPSSTGFADRMLKYHNMQYMYINQAVYLIGLRFPGVAKVMSIDWFSPWSQDDLYTMGAGLLKSEVCTPHQLIAFCVLIYR